MILQKISNLSPHPFHSGPSKKSRMGAKIIYAFFLWPSSRDFQHCKWIFPKPSRMGQGVTLAGRAQQRSVLCCFAQGESLRFRKRKTARHAAGKRVQAGFCAHSHKQLMNRFHLPSPCTWYQCFISSLLHHFSLPHRLAIKPGRTT